jgi:hypothetical protein
VNSWNGKQPMRMSRRTWIIAGSVGVAGLALAHVFRRRGEDERESAVVPAEGLPTAPEHPMGCRYTPPEQAPLERVSLRLIELPAIPGLAAVWGATGRDARGHIWFGASAAEGARRSAHLFEYDPARDVVRDRGNVVAELRRLGMLRPGEGQAKIHSRIVQGEDGHLYFTSMDEEGERTDGSRLPTWGGHLWRLRLPDCRWEHLRATPEALIAVAGGGRWIYALGYFNHMLYQYDCRTGTSRNLAVGSVGGHISRNFLCDRRGHVFVPRLRESSAGSRILTTLVQLDSELREQGDMPLGHYTPSRDDDGHGITGWQPLADQSFVFVTDQGYLYRLPAGGILDLDELGWFHPRGRTYVASVFTSDGRRHVMGLAVNDPAAEPRYEWLVYDLVTRTSTAIPLSLPLIDGQAPRASLYGSITRDDEGRCYLGGYYEARGGTRPLFLQVSRT